MRSGLFATLMVFSLMASSYSAFNAWAEELSTRTSTVPFQPLLVRSYFQNIDALHCAQVREGMTPAEVRQLCKGQPYTPFETVRNGFSFALDESHRNMFVIPNWMPNPAWILDFFVAEDEFFYVRYDDANRVALVMRYPIASKPAQSVEVISGQKNYITAPQ